MPLSASLSPSAFPTAWARTVAELRALGRLVWPLIVAQIAQMSMAVVGTLLAGQLGVRTLAAQGLGATVFTFVLISGYGLMSGLDPHVSMAVGAGQTSRAGRLFRQGFWLAVVGTIPLTLAMLAAPLALRAMGQEPALMDVVESFLWWSAPGLLPALWFSSFRSFTSAANRPRSIMVAAVIANVVHVGVCQWLTVGGWGVPAMGVEGIALASVLCRFLLVAIIAVYVKFHPHFEAFRAPRTLPVWADLRPLLASGLPLCLQYSLEVAGFVLVTLWMGLLGAEVLAAHEVALSVGAMAFQVPFALGTAAAMRVGHAIGRRDEAGVALAGWTALQVGVVYALLSAAAMIALRKPLAMAYLEAGGPAVLALTAHLLAIAAAFQLADGVQAIGFGVLRGLDDTRLPVLFNVLGFGLLGLPFGYISVFRLGMGPDMLWWGLSLALGTVALLLALRFRYLLAQRRRTAEVMALPAAMAPATEAA